MDAHMTRDAMTTQRLDMMLEDNTVKSNDVRKHKLESLVLLLIQPQRDF